MKTKGVNIQTLLKENSWLYVAIIGIVVLAVYSAVKLTFLIIENLVGLAIIVLISYWVYKYNRNKK